MRKKILVLLVFIIVSLFFFYPIFKGQVPFPGDLLLGEYTPYNSYNFLGYAPGGYPNKGQDFDVIRLLYPEKEFSIRSFKNFELPLWNPYNFLGNPHMASVQSGSFYPLNIIFVLSPFIFAWTIFIILQPVLTGLFSFLFVRELNLGIRSSVFSALIFSFSSYSIVWMEYGNIGHSILWMPFVLWIVVKNLKKPSILKSAVISFSLAFSILAGYIQTAFYVYVFVLGFIFFHTLFVDRDKRLKKILMFSLILFASILLSAVQLLPTFELIFQSARAPYATSTFLSLLISPFHAVTALVPDFFGNPATRNYWLSGTYIERVVYIGVIPLIFILYSFFKKQNSTFWFFVVSSIVVLLLTFDTFISRALYSFQIPFISTAVPTRIMFLYSFCVSIIAGFGMETLLKEQNKKIFLKVTGILGGIFFLIWLFVFIVPIVSNFSWVHSLTISRRNLILPTAIFSLSIGVLFINVFLNKYRKAIIVFIIVLSMMDLFYFFHKITPFAPIETVYPKTEVLNQLKKIQGIDRSWGYGNGYIATNLQTYEKLFSVDGYNALHIKRYGEILSSSKNGRIADSIPRSDPVIAPGYGGSDLRENKYRQRILNLLGVKYVLNKVDPQTSTEKADNQTFDDSIYKLVWQKSPWQIYENKEVLPRIFLASEYVVEKDRDKIIETIFNKNVNLRDTIILEEDIVPGIDLLDDKDAEVQIKEYFPNKILIKTKAKANMLLFISDNYYNGWKVSVDGENDKIYRANYSFRAVPVPKGNHEVIFWYSPGSFVWGLWASAVSFLSILLVLIIFMMKGRNVK
ncbi:MAG: YfhO family protein [Candidatus Levybacteria bacterium]|nr:YfhO family protein [Candidatus Levybacteria bacterium]